MTGTICNAHSSTGVCIGYKRSGRLHLSELKQSFSVPHGYHINIHLCERLVFQKIFVLEKKTGIDILGIFKKKIFIFFPENIYLVFMKSIFILRIRMQRKKIIWDSRRYCWPLALFMDGFHFKHFRVQLKICTLLLKCRPITENLQGKKTGYICHSRSHYNILYHKFKLEQLNSCKHSYSECVQWQTAWHGFFLCHM